MRGATAKAEISNKILEVFDGAFLYNGGKELRIPFSEDGDLVQIKITMTCAKENVDPEGAAIPSKATSAEPSAPISEPSAEELEAVQRLMAKLDL